jgi:hypothetical protein
VDIPIRKNIFLKMDTTVSGTAVKPPISSTPAHEDLIAQAFQASRLSLRWMLGRLGLFEETIKEAARLDGMARIAAIASLRINLHRDVITHEFFHLVGLIDKPVIANTSDALDDADTMAQLVAYVHDRSRWEDSSGLSKPAVIYPGP